MYKSCFAKLALNSSMECFVVFQNFIVFKTFPTIFAFKKKYIYFFLGFEKAYLTVAFSQLA